MSSNQAESSPVPATITSETSSGNDAVDKINFINLQCEVSSEHRKVPKTPLNDAALRERLVAVLISCHSALHQTKHLTDSYVSQTLFSKHYYLVFKCHMLLHTESS